MDFCNIFFLSLLQVACTRTVKTRKRLIRTFNTDLVRIFWNLIIQLKSLDLSVTFGNHLVRLDRYVKFTSAIAPICIDGLIPGYKPRNNAVFISGFGMTLYKKIGKANNMPECSTNSFLPRPYHTCKVRLWTDHKASLQIIQFLE